MLFLSLGGWLDKTPASAGSVVTVIHPAGCCRNKPGGWALWGTRTSGMPLLVLSSSLPRPERQHMHDSLDEILSQSEQGEMSVTINAAHVRLGANTAYSHSLSLALLVLQKVWYCSMRDQTGQTGALCYREDGRWWAWICVVSGNSSFSHPTTHTHIQRCSFVIKALKHLQLFL